MEKYIANTLRHMFGPRIDESDRHTMNFAEVIRTVKDLPGMPRTGQTIKDNRRTIAELWRSPEHPGTGMYNNKTLRHRLIWQIWPQILTAA